MQRTNSLLSDAVNPALRIPSVSHVSLRPSEAVSYLEDEFDWALRCMEAPHFMQLDRAGVPNVLLCHEFVGVARIQRAGGLYEPVPVPMGRIAYITPVRVWQAGSPESPDPDVTLLVGDIIDLIAWRPDCPGRWLRRTGAARWLGCREPREVDPFPVAMHPDPLTWFKAGAVGLVRLGQ